MVTVYFGMDGSANHMPDEVFDSVFEPKWLEEQFIKDMILDIDKTEVISPYCLNSPVLGQIAPSLLSGGVKACILIMKRPELYIDLAACGENCETWLSKIFENSDAHVAMSGAHLSFKGLTIKCICENDDSLIQNSEDWRYKMIHFNDTRNMESW